MKKLVFLLALFLVTSMTFAQETYWKLLDVDVTDDVKAARVPGLRVENHEEVVWLYVIDDPDGLIFSFVGMAKGYRMGNTYLNFQAENKDWYFLTIIHPEHESWTLRMKTEDSRRGIKRISLSEEELVQRFKMQGLMIARAITMGGYLDYVFDISGFEQVLEFFDNNKY